MNVGARLVAKLAVRGMSDPGRERTNNEDALVVADATTGDATPWPRRCDFDVSEAPVLLAVADGMGGENAGEVASALTLASLREALSKELPRRDPGAALRAAVEHANAVVTGAAGMPGREGMGATLVAVLVQGGEAYVATVGDSRVYVLRQNHLVQVTKDQSMLQFLIDSGGIAEDQIATFPQKNVILQAVGRAPDLTVPIGRIDLRRDDTLLLCTDGLTGEVRDDAIRAIVATTSLDAACSKLIEAANAAGGSDNITVVVASVSGQGLAEPSSDEVSVSAVGDERAPRRDQSGGAS
jgi:serine/threonine protein phosphatase PrpC